MRAISISTEQGIINKINAKVDFTYPNETLRYLVGVINLYQGSNPSQEYKNIYEDVYKAVKDAGAQRTIGGWLDKETNKYDVDLGCSFSDLDVALDWARAYNQKAIYDSVKDKVIYVDYYKG